MSDSIDWDRISICCPENRELAGIVRRLGGFGGSHRVSGGPQARTRDIDLLGDIRRSCLKSQSIIQLLDRAEWLRGGDEHRLMKVPGIPERLYKVTFADIWRAMVSNASAKKRFCILNPEFFWRMLHRVMSGLKQRVMPFRPFRRDCRRGQPPSCPMGGGVITRCAVVA